MYHLYNIHVKKNNKLTWAFWTNIILYPYLRWFLVPHMIWYQMLGKQPKSINKNSINKGVIYEKKFICNCNWNEHGVIVIVIEYNIMEV